MKKILLLFPFMLFFLLISCNKDDYEGYKEETSIELIGSWKIMFNQFECGEIEFTKDDEFSMKSINGNISYGVFCEHPENENSIVIIWAEDENGDEILTDEDYENGGLVCNIKKVSENTLNITNLPYFRDKTIILLKNK